MPDPTTPPAAARCEPYLCSWCGEKPSMDMMGGRWFVACDNDDCCQSGPTRPTRDEAVAAWNANHSRATHAAALRVVEAARGAVLCDVDGNPIKLNENDVHLIEALAAFDAAKGGKLWRDGSQAIAASPAAMNGPNPPIRLSARCVITSMFSGRTTRC